MCSAAAAGAAADARAQHLSSSGIASTPSPRRSIPLLSECRTIEALRQRLDALDALVAGLESAQDRLAAMPRDSVEPASRTHLKGRYLEALREQDATQQVYNHVRAGGDLEEALHINDPDIDDAGSGSDASGRNASAGETPVKKDDDAGGPPRGSPDGGAWV
jgi:hypothetical protein